MNSLLNVKLLVLCLQVENAKQDDAFSDLSNILGELKGMALDMGSEIDRFVFSLSFWVHVYVYVSSAAHSDVGNVVHEIQAEQGFGSSSGWCWGAELQSERCQSANTPFTWEVVV